VPAILLLAAVLGILLLAAAWQPATAAEPTTRPFPRIEAGQHTAPIRRIGVDAAGRWLVTASHDKTARIWELATGRLARVLRPPIGEHDDGKLYAAALSPDGRTVAVSGWTSKDGLENSIYLFDRETGTLAHRIGGLPNVAPSRTASAACRT
jgi:WD40 repeat protein